MTSRRGLVRHVFDGGWATDLTTRALALPDNTGMLRVPFLTRAEDLVYERDGSLRKAPGATKVNSAAVATGGDIHGCYDAWFHGSSGTPAQHRILNATTAIYKDDGDGTFTSIFTGLVSGAVPSYAMIEDLLVIGLDSSDTPKSWDGTTAQALAGSPPNFSIVVCHANRLWATGVYANPSRVYYSPLLDPENTTAEGWGHIDVDPSDGDKCTGLWSYKGELIVFKGTKKGSIHRIAGTAPTGGDAYRKQKWINNVGAVGQNTIFEFGDDLGFMDFNGQIRSLKATSAYGDYNEVALSRDIKTFMERANFSRLKQAWACSGSADGYVLFSLPIDGATVNSAVIGCDLRFYADGGGSPRWFYWPSYADRAMSLMTGIDPTANQKKIYFAGGGDGFLRRLQQPARLIDSAVALNMVAETPFFDSGDPLTMKTLGDAYLQYSPKNNGDITMLITRDSANPNSFTVPQRAGDPLGLTSGMNFTLNVSALSAASVVEYCFNCDDEHGGVGEFRKVKFGFSNSIVGEDVLINGFGVTFENGAISTENDQ